MEEVRVKLFLYSAIRKYLVIYSTFQTLISVVILTYSNITQSEVTQNKNITKMTCYSHSQ